MDARVAADPRSEHFKGQAWYEEYLRDWHDGELGSSAYEQTCVIARMRRGKYVRIPPQWRGRFPDKRTKRKRKQRQVRPLTTQELRSNLDMAEQMN